MYADQLKEITRRMPGVTLKVIGFSSFEKNRPIKWIAWIQLELIKHHSYDEAVELFVLSYLLNF